MRIKLLRNTKCPKKGRDGDAGYDLFLNEDIVIKAGGVTTIGTGVCVELPKGHAGLLAMRSSVCKTGLIIQQPLIDENYRGELFALVANLTNEDVKFSAGDRICSLFAFPVYHNDLEVVEELSDTNRGTSWNGSSNNFIM